ncbi:MAG: Gfo/Idh/MocA family oxidoreductase [Chloroflexi bacterium]|nr:Gfo/Idh/MocA family oxidoreductase [Chloroflexota bacterium]
MDKPTMIRIGVIGAGAIVQRRHLPGLQAIPGVQVAVVCNRRMESAAQVARTFNIREVAERWEDVVARPDIDVIWIGTTPHLHAPITIAALEAGKHVFCQARMAMNLEQARAMVAASRTHATQVTMLCPPPNGMKHGLYFEKLFRDGLIGQPFHFHLSALGAQWADPLASAHWRQQTEISGNNILSVGIYAEVLGRFMGYPYSLCAQGRVCIEERNGDQVKIPDFIQVIGQWPEKLAGVMEWSGVAQFAPHETVEIYGSEGALVYDFATDEILAGHHMDGKLVTVTIPPTFVKSWTVEADFIQAVRQGGQPQPSFEVGLRYMEFVEAVNCSMSKHAWVDLGEL